MATMTLKTANAAVSIILRGSGTASIAWGDGKNNSITLSKSDETCTHNYTASTARTITITGNVTYMECAMNRLTDLDVSGNTLLEYLNCSTNQLTSLNVSGLTKLTGLLCFQNCISNLNVSGCTQLSNIQCQVNKLTTLNLTGLTKLNILVCASNTLKSLDLSAFPNLTYLQCDGCELTSLNISRCTKIQDLYCNCNKLTNLDLRGLTQLRVLSYADNGLTALDLSGFTNLEHLWCSDNKLTSLNLNGCVNLERLFCYNNNLTSLDMSEFTKLNVLRCKNNKLSVTALNNLFASLPTIKSVVALLFIADNPGAKTCNIKAATDKKWYVDGTYILTQPVSTSVIAGSNAKFNIVATDNIMHYYDDGNNSCTPVFTWQWQGNNQSWTKITDESNPGLYKFVNYKTRITPSSELTVIKPTIDMNGYKFRCVVECNNEITVVSNVVTLSVTLPPPSMKLKTAKTDVKITLKGSGAASIVWGDGKSEDMTLSTGGATYTRRYAAPTARTITIIGNVTSLQCDDNQLTALDVTENVKLETLLCQNNQLKTLNVSANFALKTLDCKCNQLQTLYLYRRIFLKKLMISRRVTTLKEVIELKELATLTAKEFAMLKALNDFRELVKFQKLSILTGCIGLTTLYCNDNQLKSLTMDGCTALRTLHCNSNQLKILNIARCTKLTYLDCRKNQLTELHGIGLCKELDTLMCYVNQLKTLYLVNLNKLTRVECNDNKLTRVYLSGCTSITRFISNWNKLTSLNVKSCPNLMEFATTYCEMKEQALNNLFKTLNSITPPPDKIKFLCVLGNPGAKTCNIKAATDKKWYVDDTYIITQPINKSVVEGTDVTFKVVATDNIRNHFGPNGKYAPTFTWQYSANNGKLWSDIPKEDKIHSVVNDQIPITPGSELTVINAPTALSSYLYRCVVRFEEITNISNVATLKVTSKLKK